VEAAVMAAGVEAATETVSNANSMGNLLIAARPFYTFLRESRPPVTNTDPEDTLRSPATMRRRDLHPPSGETLPTSKLFAAESLAL